VAFNQGKYVALNMLGNHRPYDVVPYFFSDLADWSSMEYVGPAFEWNQEVVRGLLDDSNFSLWYLAQGRVVGALSVGRSEDLVKARELIVRQVSLDDQQVKVLEDTDADLAELD
jgi:3-phenylpropionate/trans-cinnamate dioxygenase ferredoxin reductase subunit